jgi:hypothetical protein
MLEKLTTAQKALKINLDPNIYGTFAEIGAGQEVAGNFFKAGAASGTVAKSISAYDMIFSDSIYGKETSGRYVCQSRLSKMITYEYDLVLERLLSSRKTGKYFAFANTVSARNFHGTNEAHGWLGLRFQHEESSAASDIIIHIRMHDNSNVLQQKAIGILGVNMIYASYFSSGNLKNFVQTLMDNLGRERIEIDMVSVSGPAFAHFDNRLVNLKLLELGLTDAVLFDKNGKITLPSEELYKKNILIARGSYRPPTYVNSDIMKTGVNNFSKDSNCDEASIVKLAEITITNLNSAGEFANEDFLARVDLLTSINQPVIITNFAQYFKLSNYLQRFKPHKIAIVLGAYNFMQIFDSDYNDRSESVLDSVSQLLKTNVCIYLYPFKEENQNDELISLATMKVSKENQFLMEHIKHSKQVKDLEGVDNSLLHIYSRKVLKMITSSEPGWEKYVPDEISKTINEKCLFGHPCDFPDQDN